MVNVYNFIKSLNIISIFEISNVKISKKKIIAIQFIKGFKIFFNGF